MLVSFLMMMAGVVLAEEAKDAAVSSGASTQTPPATEATAKVDTGDTAWVLVSTALVLLMTPGLAFFYGGMVGRKNVLGVLMQCFIILCVISIQWVLFGYSLSFGPGKGFWGGFGWAGLSGVGLEPFKDYAATIPHQLFMAYPDDVCHYHAGPYHRSLCRKDEIFRFRYFHGPLGNFCL